MNIQHFHHEQSGSLTYLISCPKTKEACLIDPVLDFNKDSFALSTKPDQELITAIEKSELKLKYILETHVHADHITGAYQVKALYPKAKIGISSKVQEVKDFFIDKLSLKTELKDKNFFDILFNDNDELHFGEYTIKIIATPGHTPACTCFLVNGNLFTGDTLFLPDFGTGRCDFPGGSAKDLYNSISKRLYTLPAETMFYVGHDYKPNGRELRFSATIKESMETNKHMSQGVTAEDFINFREKRDATLNNPKLLFQSLQLNIRAGDFTRVTLLNMPLSFQE